MYRTLIVVILIPFLVACASPPAATTAAVGAPRLAAVDRDPDRHVMPSPSPSTSPVAVSSPLPSAGSAPGRPGTAARLRVIGPGVDVAVVGTVGAPCVGTRPPVPMGGAYYDGCAAGLWIMAHPPYFGAMNGWAIGTPVTYYDAAGSPHAYHVTGVGVFPAGSRPLVPAGSVHFQVCTENVTGSRLVIAPSRGR